jgi:hypothetical protein
MILVGSGERNVPIATSSGAEVSLAPRRRLTLSVLEQQASRLAKTDGSKRGRDRSGTRTEVLFRLVNIVDAPPTPTDVLRVDGSHDVSTGSDTEHERFLGLDRLGIFGIPLDHKVEDRLFVLVL